MNPKSMVILVGERQSGKSLFGNFLVNGAISSPPFPFKVGSGLTSCTEHVTQMQVKYKDTNNIIIVDTPGLGDDDWKEPQNFNRLHSFMNFVTGVNSMCMCLVYKYPTVISEEYIETLLHYKKLFPSLFSHEIILVITNVRDDIEWELEQKYIGIDVEKVIYSIHSTLEDRLGLKNKMCCFSLNSLPLTSQSRCNAVRIRKNIFDRIIIPICCMKKENENGKENENEKHISKPSCWIDEDNKKVQMHIYAIDGFRMGLIQNVEKDSYPEIAQATQTILMDELSMVELKVKKCLFETELGIIDCDVHVKQMELSSCSNNVLLVADFPISAYRVIGGEIEDIRFDTSNDKTIHLINSSDQASVALYAHSRIYHAGRIAEIIHSLKCIEEMWIMMDNAMITSANNRRLSTKDKKMVEKFKVYCSEKCMEMCKLRQEYMSHDEFTKRIVTVGKME
jgi:AIG1 family